MRLVTGNNSSGNHYTEISIQVTVNGFSFIVYTVNGVGEKNIITKKTLNHHLVQQTLNGINVDVNAVKVIWANEEVELVPGEIFDNQIEDCVMVNVDMCKPIVAKWSMGEVFCNVKEQIETVFGDWIYHSHFVQTIIGGKNCVKLVLEDKCAYIVVMGAVGLENYIVAKFNSAADLVWMVKKLVKPGRQYSYSVIGDDASVLAQIEKMITVQTIFCNNPISKLCE